jgi:hypothetical protein
MDSLQDAFSMAQTGGSHLGPDQDCMVDDAEPPNRTFTGWSLFLKVTCLLLHNSIFTQWITQEDFNVYDLMKAPII